MPRGGHQQGIEEQHTDRIRRFAAVMERCCGQYDAPLSPDTLADLQQQILGPRATRYGLRRSPVFVGEFDGFTEVVPYIAPHWDHSSALLSGLGTFAERTAGAAPLVRAAVLSFGFVYIHPMADGNGRISRFLINDVLRRDGARIDRVKLRYRSRPISCTVEAGAGNHPELSLSLDQPDYGVAPGQTACLMDGERIGGHATIAS